MLTIRTRRDPAFPGRLFMQLREYSLSGEPDATRTAETVSIEDTLALVEAWLRELDDPADRAGPPGGRPLNLL